MTSMKLFTVAPTNYYMQFIVLFSIYTNEIWDQRIVSPGYEWLFDVREYGFLCYIYIVQKTVSDYLRDFNS